MLRSGPVNVKVSYLLADRDGILISLVGYVGATKTLRSLNMDLSGAHSLAVNSKYVTAIKGSGTFFVSPTFPIITFNLVSPYTMEVKDVSADNMHRLIADENYIYLAGGTQGVHVYRLGSKADATTHAGAYTDTGDVIDIQKVGNQLYSLELGGIVRILDVTVPSSPKLVKRYDTNLEATRLLYQGGNLYLYGDGGIAVVKLQ